MWVKTRLYSAARIRGLRYDIHALRKNVGKDKALCCRLLRRLKAKVLKHKTPHNLVYRALKWQREHGSGWLRPPLFRSKVEPETLRDRRLWVGYKERFQLALGIVQQTGLGV